MIWRPLIRHFLKLAIFTSGVVLLTLAAGRQFELSHAPATWVHDIVARLPHLGQTSTDTPGLTVVTIDVAQAHAADFPWARLRERILALEPLRVGLSNLPAAALESWLQPADERLIFGVFAGQLPSIPAALRSTGRSGLISSPLQEHGVVRWFDLNPDQAASDGADFVRLFNPELASPEADITAGRYRIDFNLGTQIPVIEGQRILQQGGLPQLFAARTVLVGLAVGPGEAGFHTPLNLDAPTGMPLVELQAYMIASLQQGRLERALSPSFSLLGLFALVSLTVALFVSLELLTAATLTLATSFALVLAAWLSLQFNQLWLPLFESLLTLGLAALIAAVHMWREQEKRLRAVTIDVMSRVQERLTPTNVLASKQPWEVIIAFTREVFDAQSQVFLECLPNEPRVKAIAADRYDIGSISEQRRDYRREPYISVRAAGGVTPLSRPFLSIGPDESQYMAPLEFAGELYGFWAFSVTTKSSQALPRWKNIAQGVAFQVGELLYHQRAWQQKQTRGHGSGPAEAAIPARNLYRQLAQGALKLEQRVLRLEQANSQLTTGFVRYDLFGNLVQMNARVEALARDAGLRIYELSAFQFLSRLLGDDTVLARALMNRVVFEQTTVSRPIAFPGLDEQAFYLHVHPLQRATPIELGGGLAPFDTEGILFELVTFSEVWELIGRRQTFATEQAGSILRQLAELQLAIAMPVEADSEAAAKLPLMVEQLWSEARVLAGELAQLQPTADTTLVPADIQRLLDDVLEEVADLTRQRAIRIDLPSLTSGCFVRSDPAQLKASLSVLFELLVNDAFEHSVVQLALYCLPGTVRPSLVLRLQTEGVGVPDELFQSLLNGEPGEWDPRWEALRELGSQLEPINATLRGHSEVGEGVQLEIELALIAGPGMGMLRPPA